MPFRIEPRAERIRSVLKDDGHAVMQEVELLVRVRRDDGVRIVLSLIFFV